MSVYYGRKTYKGYDIMFWLTPKTIKATIWIPDTAILVKKFWVRDRNSAYERLKKRIVTYIDEIT